MLAIIVICNRYVKCLRGQNLACKSGFISNEEHLESSNSLMGKIYSITDILSIVPRLQCLGNEAKVKFLDHPWAFSKHMFSPGHSILVAV